MSWFCRTERRVEISDAMDLYALGCAAMGHDVLLREGAFAVLEESGHLAAAAPAEPIDRAIQRVALRHLRRRILVALVVTVLSVLFAAFAWVGVPR